MSHSHGTTIGFGAALLEQLRWFWRRLRVWIVIATLLTAGSAIWIIAATPDDAGPLAYLLLGNAFHPLLVLIAISWALSAWRDDPPRDRQYFWLHPVERTAHTVARSLAGFIWLLLVIAIVIAALSVAAGMMLPEGSLAGAGRLWLYSASAIALAYIAASIPAVLSDRPGIWIVLVIAIVVIGGAVAELRQIEWLAQVVATLAGGPTSFGTALGAPGAEATRLTLENLPAGATFEGAAMAGGSEARPGTALLIWLPITTAAYLAAARLSRPR